jgi:4-hydroxy-2-oxoheptanedioate aldolase
MGLVICVITAAWIAAGLDINAQEKRVRLNRLIETLEAGKPAIAGETFTWVEQEHRGYDITGLHATIDKLLANRNVQGQPVLAPIVRIPAEGDQPSRWIIKQVLEAGAMGIIVPHVDTPEQALQIVQSIRYPQRKGAKYPNPQGRRGSGGPARNWALQSPADYIRFADVWPLNPEGELFAFPMIESPEGVKNVNALLDLPGVGGVMIGPSDLSMNSGEGGTRGPDTTAHIATVVKACVAKKKFCGITSSNDEDTKKLIDTGFKIIYGGYRKGATS